MTAMNNQNGQRYNCMSLKNHVAAILEEYFRLVRARISNGNVFREIQLHTDQQTTLRFHRTLDIFENSRSKKIRPIVQDLSHLIINRLRVIRKFMIFLA
jgi:hypothetical protein